MGSELDPTIPVMERPRMDPVKMQKEVENWSKPWQKLFLGICEDLEGVAPKTVIVSKAFDILVKRREGKKNGHKWWCDERGVWSWGLPPGEAPF